MSFKKILICFVVIIITFCLCVSASEDNAYLRINDVNNETGVVTLSGNIGADKVRNIFLIVSEKDVDISEVTVGSIARDVDFVTQIITNQDGSFNLSFKKDGSGWEEMTNYVVLVRGAMSDCTEFKFVSSSLEQTVLEAVSALTADDFEKMILSDAAFVGEHSLNNYLGIVLDDYISLENKGIINEAIILGTYSDITELKSDFESRVKAQKKWETDYKLYDNTLSELKSATIENLDTLISKHSIFFDINISDKYGYAFLKERYDAGRNDGFELLIDTIGNIDDPMNATKKIADAIILSVIKSADTAQLDDVLNYYAQTCNIDFSKYNKFNQVQKNKVLASFKGKEINNLGDVKNAFDKSVAENEIKSLGNQGNKNSSGGSYSTPLSPPIATNNDDIIFSDVPESHWAKNMISQLTGMKIINGYNDSTFKPDANISREEFVKIVVVGFGLLDSNAQCEFLDVTVDDWFYPYIASAKSRGIVQGNNNTFGSGAFISRQDATVILSRLADILDKNKGDSEEVNYTDMENISDYAQSAVNVLSALGIVNGYPDGTFKPNGNVTRAEAACLIYKMLQ